MKQLIAVSVIAIILSFVSLQSANAAIDEASFEDCWAQLSMKTGMSPADLENIKGMIKAEVFSGNPANMTDFTAKQIYACMLTGTLS